MLRRYAPSANTTLGQLVQWTADPGTLTYAWQSATALLITITSQTTAAPAHLTRIGLLECSVKSHDSFLLKSADGSSPGADTSQETRQADSVLGVGFGIWDVVVHLTPLQSMVHKLEPLLEVLGARERLFGAGIFSSRRFLYEAVGALYWLRWSANEGTALTVHDEASEALAERLRIETEEGESAGSAAFRGAWDHNAQNYVDAVQWIALKTLVNSTSRSL